MMLYFHLFFFLMFRPPPRSTLFPYTTLVRSVVRGRAGALAARGHHGADPLRRGAPLLHERPTARRVLRSEEHTSELQSRVDLVCRLLLEKKKQHNSRIKVATRTRTVTSHRPA